mmetsp:Transcript_116988/g.342622  ORF Transcript_116988/g.342622 Transcript_116988/m.342622 type:complete len:258 (+) Transcript_116988:1132-1905(+)
MQDFPQLLLPRPPLVWHHHSGVLLASVPHLASRQRRKVAEHRARTVVPYLHSSLNPAHRLLNSDLPRHQQAQRHLSAQQRRVGLEEQLHAHCRGPCLLRHSVRLHHPRAGRWAPDLADWHHCCGRAPADAAAVCRAGEGLRVGREAWQPKCFESGAAGLLHGLPCRPCSAERPSSNGSMEAVARAVRPHGRHAQGARHGHVREGRGRRGVLLLGLQRLRLPGELRGRQGRRLRGRLPCPEVARPGGGARAGPLPRGR